MQDDGLGQTRSAVQSQEDFRLEEDASGQRDWRLWGTFLPERQWGTVREDYSADGNAWESFPYEMARYRAYRWGEDGLLGWTDRECRLCFSTSLWNGRDAHLKERLFGLSNAGGNHGEDVKELYYYLDATPTGSYAKALYKYPQAAFPYDDLVRENARRDLSSPEFELIDTGAFDRDRYFDVGVEYAKNSPWDTLIRLTATNRGPEASDITLAPTLTFRNTWSWTGQARQHGDEPEMVLDGTSADGDVIVRDEALGRYRFAFVRTGAEPFQTVFTENDSNAEALGWGPSLGRFTKDAFDGLIVHGMTAAVNAARRGTKAAFVISLRLDPGESRTIFLRLVREAEGGPAAVTAAECESCFERRIAEADAFYEDRLPRRAGDDARQVARQAYAGLLWSKQAFTYDVKAWSVGDAGQPAPPLGHARTRNGNWRHLSCHDVLSMPDKWEYPWFAAWDLAFHMLPMARIDAAFAKDQLLLLLQERYLHPNGALPAYEWNFDDVNPPVHAMAVMRVYSIDKQRAGQADTLFLERAFQKLLLNFTWWVNRNDASGKDLFGGGFLGLDNIGLFDRSRRLPDGATLDQADATAWMGLFCANMLTIAVELAQTKPVYQDLAVKFFHHYLLIIDAINHFGGTGLWDEEDGFFYDQIVIGGQPPRPLRIQSIVGLVPLFAVALMRRDEHARVPEMVRQIEAGLAANPRYAAYLSRTTAAEGPHADAWFVALTPKDRLLRLLERMLDEKQFLSPYGIRSVSKRHAAEPYAIKYQDEDLEVGYVPGEGTSRLFGGNSNWRGPVWFPINILIVHALERFQDIYGDDLAVECPTGSGCMMTLGQVAADLSIRLSGLFLRGADGRRPCHGEEPRYRDDPHWRDLVLFHEYFHGDTGRGVGASHQTGWTATVVGCLDRLGFDE